MLLGNIVHMKAFGDFRRRFDEYAVGIVGLDEPGQDLVGNAVVAAVAAGEFEA